MYLLNTSTYTLHEFQAGSIPNYAILSHRWEGEEVSFRDLQSGKGPELRSFAKVKGCCNQAAADSWEYVWIDSCCIDKSSSAELSEAINSMFKWYEEAQVCYVYLLDVPVEEEDPRSENSAFRRSEWFTRGWTLQELLAPSTVIFFNCEWTEIGTKWSLYNTITSITKIEPLIGFQTACIAQKMSWLSRRKTTRVEDMAYCMMGLFGVNMPPLYGEGWGAFARLQLEILNKSDDESIFAWEPYYEHDNPSLLAARPFSFSQSGNVRAFDWISDRPCFSMTNKGLRLQLLLLELSGGEFLAPLNCKWNDSEHCLAICLERKKKNYFRRGKTGLIPWKESLYCDTKKLQPTLV
jgi:hypothetical protein